MAINRALWHRIFPKENFPKLPCPQCSNGRLILEEGSLNLMEPKYSSEWRKNNHEEWEPDFSVGRWSARLRCDEAECGEIVNMIGDVEVVEEEFALDNRTVWGYAEVLRVQSVFPAPPLFRVSKNVPRPVQEQLLLAFQMYWTDVSACTARLRTAVERILDHQGVPKERLLTQGKNSGKMHRMDLHERIDSFASGSAHKDQLQGLRNIGNLGTHGANDVEASDLFDAIDVIEFVLSGVYDTKTINAMANRLKTKKPQT